MPIMFAFFKIRKRLSYKTTFIDIFSHYSLGSFRLLEKLKLVRDTCKKDVRMRLNNFGGSIIFHKN